MEKHNIDFGPLGSNNPRMVFTDRIEICLILHGWMFNDIRIWELLYWNFALWPAMNHYGGICMRPLC